MKVRNRIKELERKKRVIEKSKEAAEMEYYQRKINEKELRGMLDEYEQQLIPINEELKELEKERQSAVNAKPRGSGSRTGA